MIWTPIGRQRRFLSSLDSTWTPPAAPSFGTTLLLRARSTCPHVRLFQETGDNDSFYIWMGHCKRGRAGTFQCRPRHQSMHRGSRSHAVQGHSGTNPLSTITCRPDPSTIKKRPTHRLKFLVQYIARAREYAVLASYSIRNPRVPRPVSNCLTAAAFSVAPEAIFIRSDRSLQGDGPVFD
jgi:hypothetical protein